MLFNKQIHADDSHYSWRDIIFLGVLSIAFCIVGIGQGSLASWDEAYYAVVTRGIIESGNWINFTFFNVPAYDKPPLYYWITAVFYHWGGINEFTTRLGSGLAGIGVVFLTYFLGLHLSKDRLVGVAGAGVLLSSTDFLHYARWGTLDMMHLFFFTAAMHCFFMTKKDSRIWFLFWAACGLAVMTKGPIIFLAWAIIGIYSLCVRDLNFFKEKNFWWGIILAGFIVFPWHIAAYFNNPQLFIQDFIHKHYISRTLTALEGHEANYYFYIRTLINKFHPWVIVALPALPWMLWRSIKHSEKRMYGFLTLWIVIVFSFFTFIVSTKLQWYSLPFYPALCLATGLAIIHWSPVRWEWLLKLSLALAVVLHIPFAHVMVQDYTPHLKSLAPLIQEKIPEDGTLYLYEHHEQPAALFYWKRYTKYIDSLKELDREISSTQQMHIFVLTDKYKMLKKDFEKRGFRVIQTTQGHHQNLVFISNGPV